MSVMSVGKKPKGPVRPLGAGNSRAGAHRGELRAGEPGAAAYRSGKRSVPGVPVAAQPAIAGPARAMTEGSGSAAGSAGPARPAGRSPPRRAS